MILRIEGAFWLDCLIFQPKGMLVKSEFVVGGLQSQTIFCGIYLSQHVSNLCISSFSSVIIIFFLIDNYISTLIDAH